MYSHSLVLFFMSVLILSLKHIIGNNLDVEKTMFCVNETKGFRLGGVVLQTVQATSRMGCAAECVLESCCRSVNYKQTENLCEFLHDITNSSSSELEEDNKYDHVVLLEPNREQSERCIPNESERTKDPTFTSCKEVYQKNSSSSSGTYILQLNKTTEKFPAYCHMSELGKCGGGGWTLVMKTDGNKETSKYSSSFWTSKNTFQVTEGLDGLTEEETKSAAYWYTPFTKICLGMTVNNVTNWLTINLSAKSLYSVIAARKTILTGVGRSEWMSLSHDFSLQPYCNMNGFNLHTSPTKMFARLGIFGNNERDCKTPDSFIGFGLGGSPCFQKLTLVCGNIICYYHRGTDQRNTAFGFILIQ